jgi:23S rRNA (guanosine2251-2'-O)-methyltransferase
MLTLMKHGGMRHGRRSGRHEAHGGGHARAGTHGATLWLHGLHAVAAALANPRRRLRRLLATPEAQPALAAAVPEPWPLQPERTEAAAIAALLPPGAVHQGLALLADPLEPPPLEDALAASDGPVLVLDQVTDPRNVGAILRSAAAFGAAAVIVQDRHAPGETGAMARAAAGALERVPLIRAVNIARAIEALKKAGLWVVGLDGDAPNTLAGAGVGDRRLALVLGAEDEGMRRLTREACDGLVRLPQTGAVESLNVSVAAAVALYAVMAGRLEQGEHRR